MITKILKQARVPGKGRVAMIQSTLENAAYTFRVTVDGRMVYIGSDRAKAERTYAEQVGDIVGELGGEGA